MTTPNPGIVVYSSDPIGKVKDPDPPNTFFDNYERIPEDPLTLENLTSLMDMSQIEILLAKLREQGYKIDVKDGVLIF